MQGIESLLINVTVIKNEEICSKATNMQSNACNNSYE